jgi:hypothetical protein
MSIWQLDMVQSPGYIEVGNGPGEENDLFSSAGHKDWHKWESFVFPILSSMWTGNHPGECLP